TFLGVPFYDGGFFDPSIAYETYKAPRNAVFQWLVGNTYFRWFAVSILPRKLLIYLSNKMTVSNTSKPPIDVRAVEFLRGIYHDDILKLQGLIDRDLSSWLV
ncbi:MAG: hypothetical protein ACE5JL_00420, partial [Dehalococcoidia bacterium]